MKVHLPLLLRASLLAACAAASLTSFSGAVVDFDNFAFENFHNVVTGAFKQQYGEGPFYDITDDVHIRNNHVSEEFFSWNERGVLSLDLRNGDTWSCIKFQNSSEFEMTGNTMEYGIELENWEDGRDKWTYQAVRKGIFDVRGPAYNDADGAEDICVFDTVRKVTIRDNHSKKTIDVHGGVGTTLRVDGGLVFRNCGDIEITGNYDDLSAFDAYPLDASWNICPWASRIQ